MTNNATFNGAFTSSNLQLTFAANGAVVNGTVSWQGASLAGDWQAAAGQTLKVDGGNYKYVNGNPTNLGTTAMQDARHPQNGHSFANQALIDGHVAPGSSGTPGTLAVSGSFVQGALGSFDVGLLDLSHFGLLNVSGSAQLGGTIEVDCVGSCSFSAGTELVVLHAGGALHGAFTNLATSGFASGAFEVACVGSDVVLRVTQNTVAAVPEPSTWALLLAGAAVIGGIARRRR